MSDGTYAGDLTPGDAYDLLRQEPDAVLVDVRTAAEWEYVGTPELGGRALFVEWQRWPDRARNPDFVGEVKAAGVPKSAPVLLLCRSGVRSKAAAIALTEAGYARCYNIIDGFEGQKDADGHRGVGGWKATGLPWSQG